MPKVLNIRICIFYGAEPGIGTVNLFAKITENLEGIRKEGEKGWKKQGAKVISADIAFPAGDSQEINFGKNLVEAQLDVTDSKESKPLKRFGEAIEVANTILFLASDEASYITGECVDVNGGMLMD